MSWFSCVLVIVVCILFVTFSTVLFCKCTLVSTLLRSALLQLKETPDTIFPEDPSFESIMRPSTRTSRQNRQYSYVRNINVLLLHGKIFKEQTVSTLDATFQEKKISEHQQMKKSSKLASEASSCALKIPAEENGQSRQLYRQSGRAPVKAWQGHLIARHSLSPAVAAG